jgi:hypothetical protein
VVLCALKKCNFCKAETGEGELRFIGQEDGSYRLFMADSRASSLLEEFFIGDIQYKEGGHRGISFRKERVYRQGRVMGRRSNENAFIVEYIKKY